MKILLACLATTGVIALLVALAQRTGQRDLARAQAIRNEQGARQARADLCRANAHLIAAGMENAELSAAIEASLDEFLEELS
jgi:hypothetical protein